MDGIKVQLSVLSDAAIALRSRNAALYDLCQQMKKQMNDLSSIWMSDGSEMIRMKFMAFSSQFENSREVIEQYASFLDRAIASYDHIESTITTNASSFH